MEKQIYNQSVAFMGCVGSDIQMPGLTLYSSKSPIMDNLSPANKEKISHLIQIDDILSLAVTMSEVGAMPNSEVSDSRMKWMLTHLCCRWDADNCLEYLLKDYFCHNPTGYIDFVNAPTIEGYTCLHLCAMWKSEKCFYVLHHYGGLNFNARDKSMKTPQETAGEYNKAGGKIKQTLDAYRTMGVSFSQVENEKLISGDVIAEDIGTEMQKKEKELMKQSQKDVVKQSQNVNNSILGTLSELEKEMLEQKKKLEKEKELIMQSKMKQQAESDAKKAQLLAENAKKKVEEVNIVEEQKKIKKQVDEESKKQQEALVAQLKAKEDELNKVKEEIKKKEEERIKKEKEDAEKKTEEFMKQKQEQINKKVKEKEEALINLKKQEEERARKEKEDADRKLKQIQDAFAKREEEMNKKLKQKEEEVERIKKEEEERLKKEREGAQKKTEEAVNKQLISYTEKVKQKEEEVRKFKEQQTYRLAKEKEDAERKAIENAREQNRIISQNVTDTKNTVNQNVNDAKNTVNTVNQNVNNVKDAVSAAVGQLKQAFSKIKMEVPLEMEKMYSAAKKSGAFFDSEFPATNQSIGDPSKSNFANFTSNTVWLRPREILKSDFKLFDGIDPNDIKQGSLGVCYMLATISALAQSPKNIENIFVFNDTSIGFYVLRFYVNGVPKLLVVDDLIPCNKTTKSPFFTKPIGNEVWVLLLEKAWAKLIGDYLSAESMTPDHMMEDLSAAPSFGSWFEKDGKPNTEHIKKIVNHSKMNHIVVITSGDKKIEGIANNHAYSMLQAYEYKGRYIFKVRNPWGQFEWNGEYGSKSSLWTPQLKTLVKFEDKDDGVFHVSETELTNAWVYYSISELTDNDLYSYTEFKSKKNEDLFYKIKITKAAEVNIRVTQLFDRMLRDKGYKYSPLVFEVGKIVSDTEVKFISEGSQKSYFGAKSVHAFENIMEKLEAGDYFVRIRMLWQNEATYSSGVLGVYAPEAVTIERLPADKGTKYMKALFYNQALSLPKNPTGEGFYKISTMKGQFVFIGEIAKDGKYKITFKFTKSKMQMAQLDLGKTSDQSIEVTFSKTEPAIATAMRTEPAKGGTTGPVSILIEKI